MATIQAPQIPISNKGFLYVNGMQLSMDSTSPLTVINVAPGQCRDYTNTSDIVINPVYNVSTVPPTLVSNYVTANLAVSGAGGIDVGSVEASTMYAVYAIGSSPNPDYPVNYAPINERPQNVLPFSEFPGTVILSKNFESPVLPPNYDMFRRIGSVVTSAGSEIVPFTQVAGNDQSRIMTYGTPIEVLANGDSTVYLNINLNNAPVKTVPVKGLNVILTVKFTPNTAANIVELKPEFNDAAYAIVSGDVANVETIAQVQCPCSVSNNLARISYKVSNANDSVDLFVAGFVDLL